MIWDEGLAPDLPFVPVTRRLRSLAKLNREEQMKRFRYAILGVAVLVAGFWLAATMLAQSPGPQASTQMTAEQQRQLDQLRQLDRQLEKDRDALHAAIAQYGWDSEQVDAAQQQLDRDRLEYRKLRRSLRATGAAVPPPTGFGAGPGGPGGGPRGHAGRRHHHSMCDCPCAM